MSIQPVVSIIVPVYKTEKYLRQCVESVLAQTYIYWELILVDDGSPDNSGRICDEYANQDTRIITIHTYNQGLSCARNNGLIHATGEFLTFLDSDDTLHPDFLKIMMEYSRYGDIICSDFTFEDFDHNLKIGSVSYNEYSGKNFTLKILYQSLNNCSNSAWGKLFRRSVFTQLFTPGIYYEDLDLFYRLFPEIHTVVHIPLPLYYYRQHSESYVHVFNPKRKDVLDVTDRMKFYFNSGGEHPDKELFKAARDRRLSAHFNILGLMAANNYNDKALESRCWKGIIEERWSSLLNPHVRSRNKIATILTIIGGKALYKIIARSFYK